MTPEEWAAHLMARQWPCTQEDLTKAFRWSENAAYERAAITAEGLGWGNLKLIEGIRALKHRDG